MLFIAEVLVIVVTLVACMWVVGHPPPEPPNYGRRRDD